DPWTAGHSLALESERPVVFQQTCLVGHQRSCVLGLRFVWITIGNCALRYAVGRENNWQLFLRDGASPLPSFIQPLSKSANQQGMVVPAFDKIDRKGGVFQS